MVARMLKTFLLANATFPVAVVAMDSYHSVTNVVIGQYNIFETMDCCQDVKKRCDWLIQYFL